MKLKELIAKHGVESVLFFLPMSPIQTVFGLISYTSSSDPQIKMLCSINEDRYKVKDGYKITLQSIEQFPRIRGKEHFYISDLESIIKDGNCEVLIKAF
jgi:hypothetical protein